MMMIIRMNNDDDDGNGLLPVSPPPPLRGRRKRLELKILLIYPDRRLEMKASSSSSHQTVSALNQGGGEMKNAWRCHWVPAGKVLDFMRRVSAPVCGDGGLKLPSSFHGPEMWIRIERTRIQLPLHDCPLNASEQSSCSFTVKGFI